MMLLDDVVCIQSAMIWHWPSHEVAATVVTDSKHVQANIMYLGNIVAGNLDGTYTACTSAVCEGLQVACR